VASSYRTFLSRRGVHGIAVHHLCLLHSWSCNAMLAHAWTQRGTHHATLPSTRWGSLLAWLAGHSTLKSLFGLPRGWDDLMTKTIFSTLSLYGTARGLSDNTIEATSASSFLHWPLPNQQLVISNFGTLQVYFTSFCHATICDRAQLYNRQDLESTFRDCAPAEQRTRSEQILPCFGTAPGLNYNDKSELQLLISTWGCPRTNHQHEIENMRVHQSSGGQKKKGINS
jgi:hypothetical protein